MVARAMSPCSRRTHAPSFRSMAGKRITISADEGSRLPFQEIGNQPQAQPLTLFRMELRADRGVASDDRSKPASIIDIGKDVLRLRSLQMKGVHEIGVQAIGAERNIAKQRMRLARIERVPPHVRYLQAGIAGRNAIDLARNPAQTIGNLIFAPAVGHQLHANADTEEWTRPPPHRFG